MSYLILNGSNDPLAEAVAKYAGLLPAFGFDALDLDTMDDGLGGRVVRLTARAGEAKWVVEDAIPAGTLKAGGDVDLDAAALLLVRFLWMRLCDKILGVAS